MIEIWKDIPGYEGYYQVSNLGRVKSLERIINVECDNKKSFQKKIKETILKTAPTKAGYLFVYLQKDTIKTKFYVARLVLLTFKGPPGKGEEACHYPINDKSNNRLDNLIWGSRKLNQSHRKEQGTYHSGEINSNAKLTNKQAKEILLSKEPTKNLKKKYNVTDVTINKIRRRVSYKHIN